MLLYSKYSRIYQNTLGTLEQNVSYFNGTMKVEKSPYQLFEDTHTYTQAYVCK